MADPISLLGLVAGIVTFVDFGLKIISGSKSVRSSLDGMIPDTSELERSIKHVQTLHNSVKAERIAGQQLSEGEAEVVAMVQESEKLYARIKCSLDKLKVRATARSKTLEAGRVTLRSLWNHSELLEMAKRLTLLDQRIRTSVQTILAMSQHISVMSKLRAVQSTQVEFGINYQSQFDNIKRDILEMLMIRERDDKIQVASQAATLESLNTKLGCFLDEYARSSFYNEVIKSLYFKEIHRRFAQVAIADKHSNDWIYDPRLTNFVAWLQSRSQKDNMFYIQGKAGSGKSTLMKCISEDERTRYHLKRWAGAKRLYISSYYFWNQGSEMQKSRIGLMQSLLYQVLCSAPALIPPSLKARLHHEAWRLEELVALLQHVADHGEAGARYCFFIDGLDEYNGDESDIVPMLQALSAIPHVKICASSRPGRIYDENLHRNKRNLNIADFTRDAMRKHVRAKLSSSAKFQRLALHEPECATIISNISQSAKGVWLWVWLVTRDILFEVERGEGIGTLRNIVKEFPRDLEQYFKRIIDRIKDRHKEEMAQIFLVTAHELQPLPLYAFTLLARERRQPGYTLHTPIQSTSDESLKPYYPIWQARIHNRCSDLLVVDQSPHPLFLTHVVDFFHRTVREFLRDCYHNELHEFLKTSFDPLVALCQICLALLKSVPVDNFRNPVSVNQIIGITDELLYYAREVEKTCSREEEDNLVAILDSLDAVNSHHAKPAMKNHWTHARDSPSGRALDDYKEGGHCNFLALAVQARLVKYVRVKLESEPRKLYKSGRPLLDYALRPLRNTPVSMPYHSIRDDPIVSVEMVKLLLSHGANPNQVVHILNGEPVWALFLISMLETKTMQHMDGVQPSLRRAWYQCCEALIENGGRFDHVPNAIKDRGRDIASILKEIFGIGEAMRLMCRIEEKAQERAGFGFSCLVM